MEAASPETRAQARLRQVEEHVRLENLHDLDGVLGTLGADPQYHDEAWEDRRAGRDGVRAYYAELFAAAGSLRIDVTSRHASDETVVIEAIITGAQTGAWRGLPPTGRPFSIPICAVFSFDPDDRISAETLYYDRATVLRQLGVFHEPTTAVGRLLTAINHPLTIAAALLRMITGR